mmetsp:Transcript_3002/g.14115  ORF Transcript_3002/g.14115 Transcript_3002/m.14115 type:complete len:251 (+) Transcript_3002:1270-2022(+)
MFARRRRRRRLREPRRGSRRCSESYPRKRHLRSRCRRRRRRRRIRPRPARPTLTTRRPRRSCEKEDMYAFNSLNNNTVPTVKIVIRDLSVDPLHEAHGVPDVSHRLLRHLVRRVRSLLQHPVEVPFLLHDLRVPRLDRREVLDDRIRQRRLEVAPSHGPALTQNLLLGHARAQLVHRQQVRRLRPFGVAKLEALERVRLAPLDLLGDLVGRVQHVDPTALRGVGLGHLRRAVREGHDPRASLRDVRVGHA